MKELKLRVAQAEAKREQQELLLDRFSELTAKQSHRNVSFGPLFYYILHQLTWFIFLVANALE